MVHIKQWPLLCYCDKQAHAALLTDDGDVRYGYLGLYQVDEDPSLIKDGHAPSDSRPDVITAPTADLDSVAVLLYRMSTGDEKMPDLSASLDEVSAKIHDPLKRELVSRSLLANKKPSAEELTRIVSELAPFDVRSFSRCTRNLIEIEKRAKAAGVEEAHRTAKLRATAPCVIICDPGNRINCVVALVQLRAFRDLGHIEPLDVIANTWPSSERARLLRGALGSLRN